MFQDERFSAHYTPTSFTSSDLIKLFEHLLIIAPLFSTTYFMPSLLAMVSPEEVSKYLPPPSSSAAPLLVHFPAGCAQNGVFCTLVVYLISKCQWEIECNPEGAPLCASRSCVRFQLLGKPVSIVLVDTFSYFEVHVTTRNTMYSKMCPIIREAIFSGLKAAAKALKYNNSTPVPAFFCKCSSPPHAATPVISDDPYLMCTKCSRSGTLTKQHSVWLDETILIRDTDDGKRCLSLCFQYTIWWSWTIAPKCSMCLQALLFQQWPYAACFSFLFYSPGVDSVALATKGLGLDRPPLSEGITVWLAVC